MWLDLFSKVWIFEVAAVTSATPSTHTVLFILILGCNGGDSCCTSSDQCNAGGGDCDSDDECKGDLVCGSDNCGGTTFDADDDCCTEPGEHKKNYNPLWNGSNHWSCMCNEAGGGGTVGSPKKTQCLKNPPPQVFLKI